MMKLSYPDTVVGNGLTYKHEVTGGVFTHPNVSHLREVVAKHCVANGLHLNNDEFEDNLCRNTPNCVCTEGIRGAGDLVHMVLNPVAKVIDSIAGTNLQGCAGCAQRQDTLNKILPT